MQEFVNSGTHSLTAEQAAQKTLLKQDAKDLKLTAEQAAQKKKPARFFALRVLTAEQAAQK